MKKLPVSIKLYTKWGSNYGIERIMMKIIITLLDAYCVPAAVLIGLAIFIYYLKAPSEFFYYYSSFSNGRLSCGKIYNLPRPHR